VTGARQKKPRTLKQRIADEKQWLSKVPPPTCPLIDEIQEDLSELRHALETLGASRGINIVCSIKKRLERIRDANDSLRDHGTTWYDLCKEFSNKV